MAITNRSRSKVSTGLIKEQRIFDEGYMAVRKMAAEMVKNEATVADVILHVNQVWHEFKVGAVMAGCPEAMINGMYIDQYSPGATKAVLKGDERYAGGYDALRAAMMKAQLLSQAEK